jgi:hypothetical protein
VNDPCHGGAGGRRLHTAIADVGEGPAGGQQSEGVCGLYLFSLCSSLCRSARRSPVTCRRAGSAQRRSEGGGGRAGEAELGGDSEQRQGSQRNYGLFSEEAGLPWLSTFSAPFVLRCRSAGARLVLTGWRLQEMILEARSLVNLVNQFIASAQKVRGVSRVSQSASLGCRAIGSSGVVDPAVTRIRLAVADHGCGDDAIDQRSVHEHFVAGEALWGAAEDVARRSCCG